MARVVANDIELEYQSQGAEGAPVVVLIMGLGRQLIGWPEQECQALVDQGLRVIRFDNRDCGLSTKFDCAGVPNIAQLTMAKLFGWRLPVPYTLDDMAADTIGLMDALNIDKAHVAGSSLGGIIAQLIACHYPERAVSLTSMMATTGNPSLPGPTAQVRQILQLPYVQDYDEEAIVERAIKLWRALSGGVYTIPEETLRRSYLAAARRAYTPNGNLRQLAASIVAGDRRRLLRKLQLPTTVFHGDRDPLIPLAGGLDTAKNIADAEMIIEPGLGHEMPPEVMPRFTEAILRSVRRAEEG
ncbi:alpha/beta hydrolase [Halioxenophilus sp. WMMB6]|uniref:alpha/beta hydrolase n=1 Tax=Halioxenophilus sp. WMMB6 TaxID=3073815 RepID=UPI00295F15FD|nr:alpha/beta hydrolase [Halioxenophilus sp. WMMB6]